jgi:hypothetical protein
MACSPVTPFLPQVTRIPIQGPAPYNTLVSVAAVGWAPLTVPTGVGQLFTQTFTFPTLFKLAGFDQRVPPVFEHSTTAWLDGVAPAESSMFQYSVNSILGAGFDPLQGVYYISGEIGLNMPKMPTAFCTPACWYWISMTVVSYVLVYEPPPPPPPPPGGKEAGIRSLPPIGVRGQLDMPGQLPALSGRGELVGTTNNYPLSVVPQMSSTSFAPGPALRSYPGRYTFKS